MDLFFPQRRKEFYAKSAEQEGIVCGSVFHAKAQRILRKERREKKAGVKIILKEKSLRASRFFVPLRAKKQKIYSETT